MATTTEAKRQGTCSFLTPYFWVQVLLVMELVNKLLYRKFVTICFQNENEIQISNGDLFCCPYRSPISSTQSSLLLEL